MQEINIDKQSEDNMGKCGIYMIKNLVNDKVYIGMTRDSFEKRLNHHIKTIKTKIHHNTHLQNSFYKYGSKSFEFSILEIILKEENNLKYFLEKENDYIICHHALSKNGYNIAFSKNRYYDLSKLDERFLSSKVRETIEIILHKKNVEFELINTLLNLKTIGEMIEYYYDFIAEDDNEFYGFIMFLDKHLTKSKVNWKLDGFSLSSCRINKCIALDDFNSFCKFYECNINELNYYHKKQCNYGDDYIKKVIDEYTELKETWN